MCFQLCPGGLPEDYLMLLVSKSCGYFLGKAEVQEVFEGQPFFSPIFLHDGTARRFTPVSVLAQVEKPAQYTLRMIIP